MDGYKVTFKIQRRNPEMKNLKKTLQSVNKDLKALSKKVDRMIVSVGKLEEAKPKLSMINRQKKLLLKNQPQRNPSN